MDADEFISEALKEWYTIAPSYVHSDVRPLTGALRELHGQGVTVTQFREALELAFANPAVTKRRALYYAYGIIRRQMEEGHDATR